MRRVIIIDTKARTFREAELPAKVKGNEVLAFLQKQVEGYIELVCVDNETDMFVDEEGLLKNPQDFFTFNGGGPFAGNAVLCGHDEEGNTQPLPERWTLDAVKAAVKFFDRLEVYFLARRSR